MNKLLLLLFLAFFSKAYGQFDTNYVYLTKKYFSVSPLMESAATSLNYDYFHNNSEDVTSLYYDTRNFNSVGIGASFYRFGFSLALEVPMTNIPQLKKQKAFSFKGGYSYRKFFAELRLRRYFGVVETIVYSDLEDDEASKIRKDIAISQYAGSIYYFFSKKFNFDANYKNYNIQKKSAISPFINVGTSAYQLKGNYLLSDSISFNQVSYLKSISNSSFRIIPGMAFSYVFRKFYLASMISYGVAFNKNRLKYNDNEILNYGYMPAFEYNASLGYSSNSFFASVSIFIESDNIKVKKSSLGFVNYLWSIKVGKKIDFKYLGKIGKYL